MSNSIPAVDIPAGGRLLGFPDLKTQSFECSADTNLLTQMAPLIASMSCELRVLKLLKPLIDVIHGLPNPPVQAVQQFSRAAADLAPCFHILTPGGMLPFVKGLICLEIRSLNCFLRNLQRVIARAGAGPGAAAEARDVLDSYQPVAGILTLAGGLFQIAGLVPPSPPTLTGGIDAASLALDEKAVADFTASLQAAADALGGCQ